MDQHIYSKRIYYSIVALLILATILGGFSKVTQATSVVTNSATLIVNDKVISPSTHTSGKKYSS